MSGISGIAATAPAPAAQAAPKGPDLGYDAFLKLLVTQMQTQDPTAPMDSSEYIAQLATFSSVEQAIETNGKLDALLTATLVGQASAVVGRTLVGADGSGGIVASVSVENGALRETLADGASVALDGGWTIAP